MLRVDLRPMGEESERSVGAGEELKEANLDHRAHLGDLLRLRHGHSRNVGQRMRDDHVLYAELFRAPSPLR
jgi:hypothetical protein